MFDNAYTPEALIAGAYQLHDITGHIAGIPTAYISISQTYSITRYVVNGRFITAPREYINDYTMTISNAYGCTDEVEGTASELLQYLRAMQQHHDALK